MTHFTGELRPDFQILFYPVITLRNATHNGSRNQFLGSNPSQYMLDLYSNELQVTKDTPKAFIMYYVPDIVVPQATNGAAYVEALRANNVLNKAKSRICVIFEGYMNCMNCFLKPSGGKC